MIETADISFNQCIVSTNVCQVFVTEEMIEGNSCIYVITGLLLPNNVSAADVHQVADHNFRNKFTNYRPIKNDLLKSVAGSQTNGADLLLHKFCFFIDCRHFDVI